MRIVSIGDIGVSDNVIHIGDEAMFHELLTQLRRRGVDEVVAISSHPAETAARYGVESVERIGFFTDAARSREVALDRMRRVIATAAGETGLLEADDTAHAVIAAIRSADGVAIAGGGNITSTWPLHIFERATIAEIARILDRPLVISGQTIGPFLTADDEVVVGQMLSSAALVGLREMPSYDYSLRLGAPASIINRTIDDASFLGLGDEASADEAALPAAPYCAVTLSSHINGEDPEIFDERMAHLLDGIVAAADLDIVFFAHFGSTRTDDSVGDTVIHERVQARMTTTRFSTQPTTDSPAAARFSRSASLVVSSRYHPAVFAVSVGVPTVGISVDDYTHVKLTGALGNFGQHAVLALPDLLAGDGGVVVAGVWNAREAVRESSAATAVTNLTASGLWWDRVADVLAGARP